jgi:hypothetical protein
MGNAFPALPGVEDLLGLMKPGVAGPAIGDGFDVFDDFVLNLEMALIALDLMSRDMSRMDQIRVGILIHSFFLKMALVAVFAGDSAVAHDDLAVAFVAAEALFEYDRVVEAGCFF